MTTKKQTRHNKKQHVAQTARNSDIELLEPVLLSFLQEQYGISKEDLVALRAEKGVAISASIPALILRDPALSSLEAIVKFLRENRQLSYAKIAELLKRNPKSLAVTYTAARRKKLAAFPATAELDKDRIPFSAFQTVPGLPAQSLSILESIASYLKSTGRNYSDIARLLNKDPRTIWTVCSRAAKKTQKNSASNPGKGGEAA